MTEYLGVKPDLRRAVSQSSAPAGFVFPPAYFSLLAVIELPDVSPIFWLLQLDQGIEDWTDLLHRQYPDRVLVPFAKDRRTDDVFCFDGRDDGGNPAVILIHSFTEPGWEYRGEWFHFDSWYAGLLDFHSNWVRGDEPTFEPPRGPEIPMTDGPTR